MWFVLLLTTNTFIDFLTTDQLCIDEAGPLTMLQMKYVLEGLCYNVSECLRSQIQAILGQILTFPDPPVTRSNFHGLKWLVLVPHV